MLVIGVAGTELTAQERDWLQHDACAGVILFTRNFASKAQVAELSQAIREAAPRPQLPAAMRTTLADRIDRRLAVFVGGSLLVHVGIAAYAWTTDVPTTPLGLSPVATT